MPRVSHVPVFEDLFPSERVSEASSDATSDSGYSSVDIEDAHFRRFPIPRLDLDRPAFILHSSGKPNIPLRNDVPPSFLSQCGVM